MTGLNLERLKSRNLVPAAVVLAVLTGSMLLGSIASVYVLAGLVAVFTMFALLRQPAASLILLVVLAMVPGLEIPTGTEVMLNPVTLLVPAIVGLLLLATMTRRPISLASSRVMLPMALFLVAGLISLIVGNATWDPLVPRGGNLLVVQIAQWALYAFSFLAFWLAASLGQELRWLKWLTVSFLVIGGTLASLLALPPTAQTALSIGTLALIRAPFWLLLTAVAGGQFLFNRHLTKWQRIGTAAIVIVSVLYTFVIAREAASNWVGVGTSLAILAWLRFKRLRWIALILVMLLLLSGLVFPTVWGFAGGDAEWTTSGQSRLVLIERVLSVSMQNPVTGLGPVSYRSYASMTPLAYGRALWLQPQVNSHNNYVDIFAQFGLLGLGLFAWMAVELGRLGFRLMKQFRDGFEAGYVRAMMAAGGGALAVMMLADWILPFVYNIGFPGFQASLLFWLFLGGLVALERVQVKEGSLSETTAA